MGSTAAVSSQLQVLPHTVQFKDVENEQQLYTTVTVKVITFDLVLTQASVYDVEQQKRQSFRSASTQ